MASADFSKSHAIYADPPCACDHHGASKRDAVDAANPSSSVAAPVPRSAAKLRVIVAHAHPLVSAQLCSSLNGLPDCDARLWNDELRRQYGSPTATGAEIVISDAASGIRLLQSTHEKAGCASSSVVMIMLCDLRTLESTGMRRLIGLEQPGHLYRTAPPSATSHPECTKGGLALRALRQVCEYVEGRLADRITDRELATVAGLSDSHFSRAFKESVGMAPHRYVSWRRIEVAARMIADTQRPLSEISLAVGFSDQSHFTRMFRRLTGETPGAFRRRQR